MAVSPFDDVEQHSGPWGESTTSLYKVLGTFIWGWTLGFAYFVTWYTVSQKVVNLKMNMYVFMLWGEFVAIISFSVASWLRLIGAISPLYVIRLGFLISWMIQLHFLMQIIINRICILLTQRNHRLCLKYGIAVLVGFITMSGLPYWLPENLKVAGNFIYVRSNRNRIEKISYSIIDAFLNFFFIYLVNFKLRAFGFRKYESLLRFNVRIVFISLIMDVILCGTMWLRVDLLYFQFIPVSNMVKLNIEMSLSDLIVALSKESVHIRDTLNEQGNLYNFHIPLELRSIEAFPPKDAQTTHTKNQS
ncbi:hypothetical protein NEOLI_004573 [Neolecta irregularis DAH-3]|uniref:Integral membrane protein n=1 Tax=Neolecta irregularis (strain DAH-3) TaxID=1198029 RepID=A0A1U7LN17_NEOID|nr:hypothetical protein NEOLI_004573 [Neolecta irregularis DAH-3]|eukprot:OLL24037.1 hypothetical protein NEOLI_004573 [Neolecta irregularis DAH-3]